MTNFSLLVVFVLLSFKAGWAFGMKGWLFYSSRPLLPELPFLHNETCASRVDQLFKEAIASKEAALKEQKTVYLSEEDLTEDKLAFIAQAYRKARYITIITKISRPLSEHEYNLINFYFPDIPSHLITTRTDSSST